MKNFLKANDSFDNLFDDFFRVSKKNVLKSDIEESDKEYLINIDVPGFSKDNISLDFEDGYLSVTAVNKDEKSNEGVKYLHRERFYGKVSRTFYIGKAIKEDEIKASFENGVLKIKLPKEEIKETKKFIDIV